MPTLAGLRRRGVTPAAIRTFCERIGVTKKDAWIEMSALESCIREDLDANAPRRLAVLDPVKVTITNLPDDAPHALAFANHPKNPAMGERSAPFSAELYIEREDFAEVPPPKFKRLIAGGEVRLRNSYVIKCEEVVKDDAGEIVELRCSADLDTLGKNPEGRKVKGVIHWVSAAESLPAEIRVYDRLFNTPNPAAAENFEDVLNPYSLQLLTNARVEPSLAQAVAGDSFQFERTGYFSLDPDSTAGKLVFNRTITLRDTWAR
jgi:glutaminyl-tRNA synthetase